MAKAATLPGFESHRIPTNGVELHAMVGGSGPALLLVHGWPETWWAWRDVMPQLALRHRVVAVDLRGFGDSARPRAGYDQATTADDLHGVVTALGLGKVGLIAHDMGGIGAYAYAVAYPDEVERFVFIESALPGLGLEAAMDVAHGGGWHFGFNMVPELPEQLVEGRERQFLSWFYTHGSARPGAIGERDIDEYLRSFAAPDGMRVAFEVYRQLFANADLNRARQNPKLAMPVLAIDGEHGLGGISAAAMRPLADDLETAIVPKAGHFTTEDNPEGVLAAIEPFLAKA